MVWLFLILGTLAAFSSDKERTAEYNFAMVFLSIGCFVCAIAMEKL